MIFRFEASYALKFCDVSSTLSIYWGGDLLWSEGNFPEFCRYGLGASDFEDLILSGPLILSGLLPSKGFECFLVVCGDILEGGIAAKIYGDDSSIGVIEGESETFFDSELRHDGNIGDPLGLFCFGLSGCAVCSRQGHYSRNSECQH